jgi:hypothetical protein
MLGKYVLHSKKVMQEVRFFVHESIHEDVNRLLKGRIVLQVDYPIMNQFSDVMHVDIDVFCSLSPHWVSAKLQCDIIVAPDDNWMMQLDTKLSEESLYPKFLNSNFDCFYVLGLH